jgi:hypothetical protein
MPFSELSRSLANGAFAPLGLWLSIHDLSDKTVGDFGAMLLLGWRTRNIGANGEPGK